MFVYVVGRVLLMINVSFYTQREDEACNGKNIVQII